MPRTLRLLSAGSLLIAPAVNDQAPVRSPLVLFTMVISGRDDETLLAPTVRMTPTEAEELAAHLTAVATEARALAFGPKASG